MNAKIVLPRCSTYLCGHCGCQLQKKAYERHKSLYYDGTTKQWIKKRQLDAHVTFELSDEDFDDIMTEDEAMTEDVSKSPPPPLIDLEATEPIVSLDESDLIAEGIYIIY